MRVLTIGSDKLLFRQDSKARERIRSYGRLFDGLDIVVFTKCGFKREALDGEVRLYPTNSFSRWLYILDAYRIGKKVIRSMPDAGKLELVISCQDPFESGLVGYFLACRFGVRLQLQVHTDFLSPYFIKGNLLNRLRRAIAGLVLPKADCLRVVSQRIKRSLIESWHLAPGKIAVLPIWSAPPRVQRIASSEFRILMVSRLEPEKRVGDGLKAFAEFLKRGGRGRMTIVGAGSDRLRLERLARELRIEDRLSFEGWQENLDKYYAEASVFLMTSTYEGWGVAAFDAVGSGLPVIMTDVGLAGEVVVDGQNGTIVPVGSIEAMTRALLELQRNPRLYARLTEGLLCSPISDSWEMYLMRYRQAMEHCARR